MADTEAKIPNPNAKPRKPRATKAVAARSPRRPAPRVAEIMGDEDFDTIPMTEGSRESRRPADYGGPTLGDRAMRSLRRLEGMVMLLLFALAVFGFCIVAYLQMQWHEAKAGKIETFSNMLSMQHRSQVKANARVATAEAAAEQPERRPAVVLTSVVSFRDGEQVTLQNNLIAPLLAFDAMLPAPKLEAVLIERTNAASRDVRVRLFTDDGNETSYLWPSTHSVNGVWASDCVTDVSAIDVENATLCPADYVPPTPAQ